MNEKSLESLKIKIKINMSIRKAGNFVMQLEGLTGYYSERDQAFNRMVSERSKSKPRGAEAREGRIPMAAKIEVGLKKFPPIDSLERISENCKNAYIIS